MFFRFIFIALQRILAAISYGLYSLPSRLKNWVKVRIFREHKKLICLKKSEKESSNIAVIALWPRMGILTSVLHQVDILLKLDQHVICVINKSKLSDTWIKELEQFPITILIRENIGRDFGAFQAGINYVQREIGLSSVANLTLANDTIFYAQDSLEVIRDTLNQQGDVKCIYLNLQAHLHAQSFFLTFSKRVIDSKVFARFWQTYYPSNERFHAINNGEVKLSRILDKRNFKFASYVNAERLNDIFSTTEPLSLSELGACYEIEGNSSEIRKKTYLSRDYHRLQSERVLVSKNASHLLGLYLFRVKSIPLKLDLMQRGFHSSSDIISVFRLKNFSNETISDFESMLYKQGSWGTVMGIRVLWRNYGLI